MIAKLKGRVDYKGDDFLIIDTGSIGYQVFVSQMTKSAVEEYAALYTLEVMRNERPHLVGFMSIDEKLMFEVLLSVQGVGMKMALSLMSLMNVGELAYAILHQEKKKLKNADGVGERLAERIILELKNKISPHWASQEASLSFNQDVIETLVSLGYGRQESIAYAKEIIAKYPEMKKTEELVRLVLREKIAVG